MLTKTYKPNIAIHPGETLEEKGSPDPVKFLSEKDFSLTEVKAMNADITRQIKSGESTKCTDLSSAKKHLKMLKK